MIEAVNEVTHSCKKVLSVRKPVTNKNSMVLLELSKEKVYSLVMTRLKTDISPGLGGISAKDVVNNIDTLLPFITDLFSMSIR